jgi:nucleoside-diphosphate-sugar epimerase
MRIFVAGATGAVGRLLVPMLVGAGHSVSATSRSEAGLATLRAAGVDAFAADVYNPEALAAAVRAAAPEVVIHQLTALREYDVAANARIRTVGTRNLVDAALAAGARRMIAQSISWAYQPGAEPADEQTPLDLAAAPPRAHTISGIRALEDAVAELPEHVVLRYGTLYGPGTWYAAGERIAGQLRNGELAADAAVSSFLHVEDAARAAVAALDWAGGPVNVVDDDPAPATEWLPRLAEALGQPAPPIRDGARPGWARGATNALARNKLDWAPSRPSWRTGFAEPSRAAGATYSA